MATVRAGTIVFGVLATLSSTDARSEDSRLAGVFGIDRGATADAVKAAFHDAGFECQAAAQDALVCPTGITQLTTNAGPVTFWLLNGRVSRIYQVSDLKGIERYAEIENLFRQRVHQIQAVTGATPPQTIAHEPPWFGNLDDESKMAWLRSGTFGREIFWQADSGKLSLLLRGEKGRVLVVLGLEAAATRAEKTEMRQRAGSGAASAATPVPPTELAPRAPAAKSCSSTDVAAWMMDLFPPADIGARAAAAKSLADCGVGRSSGALAAALERDRDPSVRTATLNALGELGHTEPLHKVLTDSKESDSLRASALRALDKRGEAPDDGERQRLHRKAGSELARALDDLQPMHAKAAPIERTKESATAQVTKTPVAPKSPQLAPTPTVAVAAPTLAATTVVPAPPMPAPAKAATPSPVHYTLIEHEPAPPAPPPVPPPPPKPSDGAALAITTSTLAGGLWGAGLAKLALQDDVRFITIAGSAGAIIGGGTALGLVHFGKRPSPEQALFYTNTTAWGSLAGLLAWAGSGSDSMKLKYGLLVGGELGGMAAGVYGARRWQWTASQVFVADSLVAAAGVGGLGVERMLTDSVKLDVPAWVGFGAAPAMVAAAVASRYLDVSGNDLRFAGVAGVDTAWTAGLIASGIDRSGLFNGHVGQGGLMLGFSAGYLAALAASPFIEVGGSQALLGSGALLLGNSMGLGAHMLLAPNDRSAWTLGAGLGGVGLLAAGALVAPYLRLGPEATGMAAGGVVFGAGTWAAATAAAGRPADARLSGGLLAFAPAAGIVGALASARWNPDSADYATTAATTALGMGAGLGVGMLSTPSRGNGEFAGVLGGSVAGLAGGALFAHHARLQLPDLGGAGLGAAEGLLLGELLPTLNRQGWENSRNTQGASWLGVSTGAVAGAALSHITAASGGNVLVTSTGGLLGAGAGVGAGLLSGRSESQPTRIGAVAGSLGGLAGAMVLDRTLHLGDGVGPSAAAMAPFGGLAGAINGALLADVMHPDPEADNARARQGGALMGASLGVASGLVLSKFYAPEAQDFGNVAGMSVAGGLFGRGVATLAVPHPSDNRADATGTLAGSLGGFAAGALVDHYVRLRGADYLALSLGLGFGGVAGGIAPSLGDANWQGWQRRNDGGLELGVSAGGIAAAGLAHATSASANAVTVVGLGGVDGLVAGIGLGAMLEGATSSRGQRIGAVGGPLVGALGLGLLDRQLRLRDGMAPSAALLALVGGVAGGVNGGFLGDVLYPKGAPGNDSTKAHAGGAVFGASVGITSGLLLSTRLDPDGPALATATGGSVAGALMGRGLMMLAMPTPSTSRADSAGTMAGSLAGLGAGVLLANQAPLTAADAMAVPFGAGLGGLVGALAPTLDETNWRRGQRDTDGGLMLGIGAGTVAATALSHMTKASPAQVAAVGLGNLDGALAGLGIGMMLDPEDQDRAARIGVVAGTAGGLAMSLLLEKTLHLEEGFGPSAVGMGVFGTGFGAVEGLLAGDVAHPQNDGGQRALQGGALAGSALGLASSLVLSRFYAPDAKDLGTAAGTSAAGAALGRGLAMLALADPTSSRPDSAATLAGSLAGLGVGAWVGHYAPLDATDYVAAPYGAAIGGLAGALAPSLSDATWAGMNRPNQGGLLAGAAAGTLAGTALAHATGASPLAASLSSLGALDGMVTGMGVGMMLDGEGSSQAQRIGMVAGLGAGLGVGAGLWGRSQFHEGTVPFVSAALAIGGFDGALVPRLGHARSSDVGTKASQGGVLAGAGAGALVAASLATQLDVDSDMTINALTLDALWTGAGAGIGVLASKRDDAPVLGMLAGGGAGLLLGAALHSTIDIDEEQVPFIATATAHGLWFGGFLPYVLRPSSDVEDSHIAAGLAAGGLGAAGWSMLTSHWVSPSGERLAKAGMGSAMGAALAGGTALLTKDLNPQAGYGMMLGGTALGLGAGTLVGSYVDLHDSAGTVLAGSALGAAEGLVFAWAGRGSGDRDYAGAGLIGAGLGTGLGVAAATTTDVGTSKALTSVGFSAWGAWMGAFSGALASRDSHEVTLGGLGGANVGALIGYGLVRTDVVNPRDFGWLSLTAAVGAALGGGVGAALSSKDDPRPALAGLAVGPLAGLAAGAIVIPRLRASGESHSWWAPARKVAGVSVHVDVNEASQRDATSADVLAQAKPSFFKGAFSHLRNLFDVETWSPMVGALPAEPGTGASTPFLLGVTGTLR